MTEIVKADPIATNLPDMVRYAEHLADANLLPGQYRRQPANVLYAMEYGRTLGITPLAAITGIHVIEGKPSASSALISGLVRQAGHKLRVSGNGLSATAEIIRSDDPEFTYSVTWELRRNANGNPNAEDAGLINKQVWKNYPAAMLKARAITQVARDACEEVLFGLHYTPEELGAYVDQDGNPVDAPVQPLRPVEQLAENDQAVKGRSPQAQGYADRAAQTTDPDAVKEVYREAHAASLLTETVKVDRELLELGEYLISRGQRLSVGPQPESSDPEAELVLDGEIVTDGVDPWQCALDDLKDAADNAGLTPQDLEEGFQTAHGVPTTEATIEALQQMTAILKAGAA